MIWKCTKQAMPLLADLALKVRSKNAGPFTATVDIFCGSAESFETIRRRVNERTVSELYKVRLDSVRKFEIPHLHVLKFSFPRPSVQGSRTDRDMHAAQLAELLLELPVSRG